MLTAGQTVYVLQGFFFHLTYCTWVFCFSSLLVWFISVKEKSFFHKWMREVCWSCWELLALRHVNKLLQRLRLSSSFHCDELFTMINRTAQNCVKFITVFSETFVNVCICLPCVPTSNWFWDFQEDTTGLTFDPLISDISINENVQMDCESREERLAMFFSVWAPWKNSPASPSAADGRALW